MQSVPQPDPTTPQMRRDQARVRYLKLMRWMVLAAIVAAGLAMIYVSALGPTTIHALIATGAGVGFSVLLGTALMGLVYFSNASGHDEPATTRSSDDDR